MTQPTVALAMIVKGTADEAPLLDNCLTSVQEYVDGIFLNINTPKGTKPAKEVLEIAKQHNAAYIITEWAGNFVEARNRSFSMVPESVDWVMWLDTDDTVDKPEELKRVIAVASKAQHGIYVNYEYDHDDYGNVTVNHYVARIVRNNGSYTWKSSVRDEKIAVHETLVEVIPRPKAVCNDFNIIHHAEGERKEASLIRNIDLLEKMLENQQEAGEIDPRTLFYLATHYFDANQFAGAKDLLQQYMQLSGWAEERCEALVYLGKIYEAEGKEDQAHHAYLLAIGEYQNSPRPYLELSELDFRRKRYEESASWIEKLLALPKPSTTMVQRPMENKFRAYLLAAQAYINIGGKKLDEAKLMIEKALNLRPLDEDAKRAQDIIDNLIDKREDIRAALRIVHKFETSDKNKIVPFLDTLPLEVQDNPLILNTRHAYAEPTKWPKKSIALYVGQGPLGIWGPWSLKDGIGGSEEAVVQLSRQLSLLGWKVTIFATPGDRAGYDQYRGYAMSEELGDKTGETDYFAPLWKQYYEFNPKDEFDVLIAWRNPGFFDYEFKARKKYLWLHDVMDNEEFTKERLNNLDKVIFVGQYHAELYRGIIQEEKWFVSGNGIMPEAFEGKQLERIPHRMVYMSSYNRGLKILLDHWDEIKKEVPDATLDIYYGWGSYDALNKDNPERMEWKNSMVKQMKKLDDVTDHGKISHEQIIHEIMTADIFAYPCIFPEVYCISYIKAISGGAYPVTSDYAELEHYKKHGGIQAHYEQGKFTEFVDEYIAKLIKALKSSDRTLTVNRDEYSWKTTAKNWAKEMN